MDISLTKSDCLWTDVFQIIWTIPGYRIYDIWYVFFRFLSFSLSGNPQIAYQISYHRYAYHHHNPRIFYRIYQYPFSRSYPCYQYRYRLSRLFSPRRIA